MSLQAGQVIRYADQLWRVDHCNASRARIVPLAKHTRVDDSERGGVNISPNSYVEVITDIEAARTRLELAAVEAELVKVKREMARQEAPTPPTQPARRPTVSSSRAGWGLGPTSTPALRLGSQAALVVAYITTHPGVQMGDIGTALPTITNLPQCLSRLKLTGYIKRV